MSTSILSSRAKEQALHLYLLTESFPRAERYALSSQLRRAGVSCASNISEGYGRFTTGEYLQFLGMARGSNEEIGTQLEIAQQLGFGDPKGMAQAQALNLEVRRLLCAVMRSLRARTRKAQ